MCFRSHYLSITCPLEPHLGPWAWGTCGGCHVGSLWPLSPPPAARSEEPATSAPCSPCGWLLGPGHLGQRRGERAEAAGRPGGGGDLLPPSLWFSGPGQPLPAICPSPGPYQKGLFPQLLPTPSPLPLPRGQRGVGGEGTERYSALLTEGSWCWGWASFMDTPSKWFPFFASPSPPGSPGPAASVASPGLVRIPFSPNSVPGPHVMPGLVRGLGGDQNKGQDAPCPSELTAQWEDAGPAPSKREKYSSRTVCAKCWWIEGRRGGWGCDQREGRVDDFLP